MQRSGDRADDVLECGGPGDRGGRPQAGHHRAAVDTVRIGQVARIDDRFDGRIRRAQPDRAAAAGFEQDRTGGDGMPGVRLTDTLIEEWGGRPNQFDVRQVEIISAAHEPVGLTDVGGQHAPATEQVIEQLAGLLGIEEAVVAHVESQCGDQVIQQIFAHLGGVVGETNSELGQLFLITDPGQHQQLRCVHRTSAQHHLASGPHRLPAPIGVVELDPDSAAALEDHPAHRRVGQQGQVRAVQHRLEIGIRAAPPGTATLRHRGLTKTIEHRCVGRSHPVASLLGRPQPCRRRGPRTALR